MKYGCIGKQLKHSFSKEIHEEFAPYSYDICEIPPEELESFMKQGDFSAINVTIPYKEAVIPYLFSISERAQKIGAVNTIVNRNGKLYGYNTDFFGMKSLICKMGISLNNKKVAILGTGGTSKTAKAVAESMGASLILNVSRTEKEGAITYQELYKNYSDAEIIINTTPSGMFPNWNSVPVDIKKFNNLCGVVDVVYNPLNTLLVREAKSLGIKAESGLYMLVAQAVRASEIFLDTKYSEDTIDKVYSKIRLPKRNIVLTGMPGSGKSTVGKIISEKLNMQFYDSDEFIEKIFDKKISAIFSDEGEEFFRVNESEVICQLGSKNGIVLSTGGGAILRDINIDGMKQNGTVYFLDRPINELIPTDDRPLARSKEDIIKRYNERYNTYVSTADVIIPVDGTPEKIADKIIKDFLNYETLYN